MFFFHVHVAVGTEGDPFCFRGVASVVRSIPVRSVRHCSRHGGRGSVLSSGDCAIARPTHRACCGRPASAAIPASGEYFSPRICRVISYTSLKNSRNVSSIFNSCSSVKVLNLSVTIASAGSFRVRHEGGKARNVSGGINRAFFFLT